MMLCNWRTFTDAPQQCLLGVDVQLPPLIDMPSIAARLFAALMAWHRWSAADASIGVYRHSARRAAFTPNTSLRSAPQKHACWHLCRRGATRPPNRTSYGGFASASRSRIIGRNTKSACPVLRKVSESLRQDRFSPCNEAIRKSTRSRQSDSAGAAISHRQGGLGDCTVGASDFP